MVDKVVNQATWSIVKAIPGFNQGDLPISLAMNDEQQSNHRYASLAWRRQTGLWAGLAISMAVAAALLFWAQTSAMPLMSKFINGNNTIDILELLGAEGIGYNVEPTTGNIMVPIDRANEITLGLTALGQSKKNHPRAFPARDSETGFVNDLQMMRFHKNLESEIAETLMSIENIKKARVLLSLPGQPGIPQEFGRSSAAVMVTVKKGHFLKTNQIEAIIRLVAASVPKLETEQVTLIDQSGLLLSSGHSSPITDLNARQFEYKKNLEAHLIEGIRTILTPIVGVEGLRAQVSATLNFSGSRRSQENPDSNVRKPKIQQFSPAQGEMPSEPPGRSNQPAAAGMNAQKPAPATPANNSLSSRRVVSKKKGKQAGVNAAESGHDVEATLQRLSVAVVVDDQKLTREDGTVTFQPFQQDELDRFSNLVKQAVGFDSSRGDQLTMTAAAFKKTSAEQATSEPPFWRQSWFFVIAKQLTVILAILLLFFGIIRPLVRSMLARNDVRAKTAARFSASLSREAGKKSGLYFDQSSFPSVHPDEIRQSLRAMPNDINAILLLDTPQNYQHRLEYIKKIADADVLLVAEVIKFWVKSDG